MQRIAKFEKVSFEQFKKDWQGEHPQDTEEVIRDQTSEACHSRLCRI